jgi:hypothetical protein
VTAKVPVSMLASTSPPAPAIVSAPCLTFSWTCSGIACPSPFQGRSMQRAVRVRVFSAWTNACDAPPL